MVAGAEGGFGRYHDCSVSFPFRFGGARNRQAGPDLKRFWLRLFRHPPEPIRGQFLDLSAKFFLEPASLLAIRARNLDKNFDLSRSLDEHHIRPAALEKLVLAFL